VYRWIARFCAALVVWCATGSVAAAQSDAQRPLLHPLFTDHAVLQRGRPIEVWGWAAPRERVAVTLEDSRISGPLREPIARTRADASGAWRVSIRAHEGGGPYTLTVRTQSGGEQTISDLMIGDVYLCSGQSNMEFQTRYATNAYTVLGAASNDRIRLFNVARATAEAPQSLFASPHRWMTATSETVADFSAVCYFFGRDIEHAQHVPVGLINASWGGTIIEAWTSNRELRRIGGFEAALALIAQGRADPQGARAEFAQSMQAWQRAHDPGARESWSRADLDESDWRPIAPAGFWENSGEPALANFDGIVWYRTRFTLTAEQAARGGRLALGPADDIDAVYLNGAWIGGVQGWDVPRFYDAPPAALRAGENVLAIGVIDTGGGGGLWGPAEEKALTLAGGDVVPLNNAWRYRISAPLSETGAPPQSPWAIPNALSVLYNGMIAPLAPYGLRGVLWYQGEANAGAPAEYERLLPAMMHDWRGTFASPTLPFLIVQLANYGAPANAPQPNSWGAIRDVQRRVAAADPHAGMAVAIDIGDRFDIHPTQKQIVAERLARIARHRIYGEAIADSGPSPISAQRNGSDILVTFAHGPLLAYSASRPIAFEVCDAARACRFVDAAIEGANVRLNARGAQGAAFVRYCWGDAPICNLYNDADLPAAPFEMAIQ
jgi:sialate O-acetylesterase